MYCCGPVGKATGIALGCVGALLTAGALTHSSANREPKVRSSTAFYSYCGRDAGGLATLLLACALARVEFAPLVWSGLFGVAHIVMTLAWRYAQASRARAFRNIYPALVWPVPADGAVWQDRAPAASPEPARPLTLKRGSVSGDGRAG